MKIALGVTGGIAAYKAAEILRMLQDRGIHVQVVMTRGAQEFVRPLTFAALSGEKVITEMFSEYESNVDSAVEHISVAQSIDALVVAPATADTLAKFANGIANDFLSTLYLATTAPVIVAPAMNVNMWQHEATRKNIETLRQRGVRVVEPGSGYLACGMLGAGRLAEPEQIIESVMETLGVAQDLKDETVLVTAGPTFEPIDPVRYLGNRSSGKMGYAIAEAAVRRGARVILVSGPTALKAPAAAEVVQVERAQQMREAVLVRFPDVSVVIKTAAVADYRPAQVATHKIKRGKAISLALEPTTDILAELGTQKFPQHILVGFAAETENLIDNARKKLASKHADAIVLNDVSRSEIGFGSDRNAVTIVTASEVLDVPDAPKFEIAQRVLDTVVELRRKRAVKPAPEQPTTAHK
ncbi:MAG TPA: bifunctional phosphopantothenoylcysteine decarboxylase/phosphopantothenate--cysteine ligase CoaBC [Clostridia bacterium]|nr:bifunctional phosphopantothenoylcysteine decarboxylase/phosphopantothenate--cysteine ligase CoaBC [Clostridia bacterium]